MKLLRLGLAKAGLTDYYEPYEKYVINENVWRVYCRNCNGFFLDRVHGYTAGGMYYFKCPVCGFKVLLAEPPTREFDVNVIIKYWHPEISKDKNVFFVKGCSFKIKTRMSPLELRRWSEEAYTEWFENKFPEREIIKLDVKISKGQCRK